MADTITKAQLEELRQMRSVDLREYHFLLKKYAGITAEPYTGYSYYDKAGDYIGDSETSIDVETDLLDSACIQVRD